MPAAYCVLPADRCLLPQMGGVSAGLKPIKLHQMKFPAGAYRLFRNTPGLYLPHPDHPAINKRDPLNIKQTGFSE